MTLEGNKQDPPTKTYLHQHVVYCRFYDLCMKIYRNHYNQTKKKHDSTHRVPYQLTNVCQNDTVVTVVASSESSLLGVFFLGNPPKTMELPGGFV